MHLPRRILGLTVAALAISASSSGALASNEGAYGASAELTLKCSMHWTRACDLAYGVSADAANRSPISPMGEGLPLPWPFPWKKIILPVEG